MVKIDKLSGSKVRIEIEVTKEQFEHGLSHAFEGIKDEVEIKGFRKGKVTRAMYEQHFGVESLYDEAINHVIQETYVDAVITEKVDVVAQPKIDLDVTKVAKNKGFTYTAEVAVKPEVTLGDYKGLTFEKLSDEVKEDDVAKEIAKLTAGNAELVLKEEGTLENGDTAIFDFEGFVDNEPFEGGKAENYELVMGSGQFIPGFEDQMVGMTLGEEKDVNVKFPEDYHAENLKGKDAVFKVKLHEMKFQETPELTDDFVKSLDKEGIETVEALKADTLAKLQEALTQTNKNKVIDFAVEEASKNATFEMAEEMILEEKNRLMDNTIQQAKQYGLDLDTYLMYSGMNKEQFEAQLMLDAKRSLSYNLVIEAIALKEEIKATEDEVNAKFEELATQYNMGLEQIKGQVSTEAIEQEVVFKKTIDFLVENLNIQ
ncbi:trigger factor [Candidatus Izimaplasma bacterium ZiA1]|uniref:trigger factor n=1 Tax=Candidatus Izimoplasma sp. ZiA1 TaxID=2024899 RepID=UPI00143AD76E